MSLSSWLRRQILGKQNQEESEELVKETSHSLVVSALNSAHKVFLDRKFREFFDFEKQKQVEQDRLFNELSVTALCLLLFILEDIAVRKKDDVDRYFLEQVRQQIPYVFQDWLLKIGVPKKFASMWAGLIDMRYEEYQKNQQEFKQEMQKRNKVFQKEKSEMAKDAYVRFQSIAIDAIHHLRRGKTNPKDPFYKHLLTWLGVLNIQLEKKIYKI